MKIGYLLYSIQFGDSPDEETESTWVVRVAEEPGCTDEFVHTSEGRPYRRFDLTIFATEEEARQEASG